MHRVRLGGNERVILEDAPDPAPGAGEVVVQTAVSAICGSELHDYRTAGVQGGNNGHEAVGTIVAVGPGVDRFSVGDRVGASAVAGCGECEHCREGRYIWCERRRFYGGMHADRFVAAALACYPLPDAVSWEAGALLTGDGIGVPYHTSRKIASSRIATVAVFGVGPIGLGNVMMQRHLGRRTIAVDLSPRRLEAACELGASETVHAGEVDPVEAVRELTGGVGADVCIEAAGRPETALGCFVAVRTGGTVVFNGEQGPVGLSPSDHFIRREVTAVGSWFYFFSEIPAMIDLYLNGFPATDLISHRFPPHEAQDAYREFSAGNTAKAILVWHDE